MLLNRLLATASERLPDVSRKIIISTGATDLERAFAGDQLLAIRESYLDGLRAAWAMAIAFAGIALLTGLTLGFNKIKQPPQGGDPTTDVDTKVEEEKAGDLENQKVNDSKSPGA